MRLRENLHKEGVTQIMITSSWICPACGKREVYKDDGETTYMHCKCPYCQAKFAVDVESTESE
ncbi:MAG: hypothetical protein WD512_08270 [Candidatus Paceibacterota bacterium]